jgi:hypothetical protein
MRSVVFTVLAAMLAFPLSVSARPHALRLGPAISCDPESPVEWGDRHDLRGARCAVLTQDRAVALVLTRDVVAVELSDRYLRDLDREMDRERDDDDGVIAQAIKDAVLDGVRSVLDHSLECPLDELSDVRYRAGRLELLTRDGGSVFDDLEVDGRRVLESIPEHEARAFVREFHRLRGAGD